MTLLKFNEANKVSVDPFALRTGEEKLEEKVERREAELLKEGIEEKY